MRRDEIASLSGPDEFGEFYRRLKSLKDFHRRNPHEIEAPMAMEFIRLDRHRLHPPEHMQTLVDFTDEEGYGKFLDMHELYDTLVNLKQMEVSIGSPLWQISCSNTPVLISQKVDYLTYLSSFDRLFEIPKEKKTPEYKRSGKFEMLLMWLTLSYCVQVSDKSVGIS